MKVSVLGQEKLMEDLVDELADMVSNSRKLADILKITQENELIQNKNLKETDKLKERISILENRIDKYANSFRIFAIEVERELSEKYRSLEEDNEKRVVHLQGQLENLRTAMIKLSSEVKGLKDILAPSK